MIRESLYYLEQSWNYERITESGNFKYRVLIRRNSHDFQSYVRGFVLDPIHKKWNQVVDRPIQIAACKSVSYVDKETQEMRRLFEQDAFNVVNELRAICE